MNSIAHDIAMLQATIELIGENHVAKFGLIIR